MDAFVVNAFTDTPFRGNPAGVVLLREPASDNWMRSVAAEFNHPETAFVVLDGSEAKPLRWFSPTAEVNLCGHATLATAHVLGGDQRFSTRSGELTCTDVGEGWIEMDFPADPLTLIDAPADLAEALPGVTPRAVAKGTDKLLVELATADEVRELTPDLTAVARIPAQGVLVTAPGDRDGLDIVSRFFAPKLGIPEDPVTGSAHCTLASWWSDKLERNTLNAEQLSARGGAVHVELRGDRVRLRGQAVTVFTGELLA